MILFPPLIYEFGYQGHFSAAFMTWHSMFMLEFENSLLAVDPQIEGLPYWNSAISNTSIFTSNLFGSTPGTGDSSRVIDGRFANWPISKQPSWQLAHYSAYWQNPQYIAFQNSATGYLRQVNINLSLLYMLFSVLLLDWKL
jgi:hypothetical protein